VNAKIPLEKTYSSRSCRIVCRTDEILLVIVCSDVRVSSIPSTSSMIVVLVIGDEV